MRIEKLNENKIRIFLNIEDLNEKNIDMHDFMSNSIESQDLFIEMLNKAETEIGFKTHNYKLIIEALASSDGNFILTVTRTKPEVSKSNIKQLNPKSKRRISQANKLLSIYSFNNFDEFCDYCYYINSTMSDEYIKKLKNSSLVLFNNIYYLILTNLKLNIAELKTFSYKISEFATKVNDENLIERKLKEYGKNIIAKNAIATCLKYFNNNKS